MERAQLRVVSSTGLIGGGLLFLVWSVGGLRVVPMYGQARKYVLLAGFAGFVVGFASLSRMAARTDDEIESAVTPLAFGMSLLAPLFLATTLNLYVGQGIFGSLLLVVSIVGLLAVVFGCGLLVGVLVFSSDSTVVSQQLGGIAVFLAISGVIGWVVSLAIGAPEPPQAFRIINPYTSPVAQAALWTVIGAFSTIGLALSILGVAVLRERDATPRTEGRWPVY